MSARKRTPPAPTRKGKPPAPPRKGKATTSRATRDAKGRPRPTRRQGIPTLPATPPGTAAFGETFFSRVLPGMVQGCPCDADGHEPIVRLHLVDGSAIELAQIVALADRYAVFAVFEGVGADGVERTPDDIGLQALPYELIAFVTVRAEALRGHKLGFQLPVEDGTAPRVAALETLPAASAIGDDGDDGD